MTSRTMGSFIGLMSTSTTYVQSRALDAGMGQTLRTNPRRGREEYQERELHIHIQQTPPPQGTTEPEAGWLRGSA